MEKRSLRQLPAPFVAFRSRDKPRLAHRAGREARIELVEWGDSERRRLSIRRQDPQVAAGLGMDATNNSVPSGSIS
jgi:hypothetical protein